MKDLKKTLMKTSDLTRYNLLNVIYLFTIPTSDCHLFRPSFTIQNSYLNKVIEMSAKFGFHLDFDFLKGAFGVSIFLIAFVFSKSEGLRKAKIFFFGVLYSKWKSFAIRVCNRQNPTVTDWKN